jgi:AcrR family transcriptional regulator
MARRATKKRAYLAKDDRHSALLEAAASVVEKQGWPALSMISVAEHAKVSRQLVYEHFASVDELMTEVMSHIFREGYENLRDTIRRSPGNVADLTAAAERLTFGDQSPGRIRALWQMITATYSENAETARMSRRLRHLVTNLWTPIVGDSMGLDERESQVMTWMLNMAFWGAHQLVDMGEADRDTALRLFNWMVVQLQAGSVVNPLPRADAKAARRRAA